MNAAAHIPTSPSMQGAWATQALAGQAGDPVEPLEAAELDGESRRAPPAVDPDATFGALLHMQSALRAARNAHEQVVSLAVDFIGLTRAGRRDDAFDLAAEAFDAAVMALGLAALEHLPLAWSSVSAEGAAAALDELRPRPMTPVAGAKPFESIEDSELFRWSAAPAEMQVPAWAAPTQAEVAPIEAPAEAPADAPASDPLGAAPAVASGPVDLRGHYTDPDEDSMVDWPTEDPGPVGRRPMAALTPEVLQALQSRLSNGAGPVDPPDLEPGSGLDGAARPTAPPKNTALEALRGLALVPDRIESEAAFAEEYRRLQSCADPTRLAALDALSRVAQAQVAEYLSARLHRLWREVPSPFRPAFVAGENAYRAVIKALSQHVVTLRRLTPAIEPLRLAPRQRDWLREAEVLEGPVRAAIAAAAGGAAPPPAVPAVRGPVFNLERALDELGRAVDAEVTTAELAAQVKALLAAGAAPDDPRLCAALSERIEELMGPGFKTLRAKVRRFTKAQAEEDASPEPWGVAARLAGRAVLLVGGDRTAGLLERLRQRLPGVSLEWVETSQSTGVRQVQAASDRVANGSIDLLLLIQRFVSHKVTDVILSAVKASQVPLQTVRRGYGLSQVRAALEAAAPT